MRCARCASSIPEGARFCPACGGAVGDDDVTVGVGDAATRLSGASEPLQTARRTPTGSRSGSGGWLTSSDSIDHGHFAPGEILDARYRIIGLLGRGGMGEVYRADDLRLGQPVALKFLPNDLRGDPVRLAQFHNEVRTARQVSHPNVCRVYDIGEAAGRLYLSMEYVDGEDLATSLRRIGRFPEDKATEIARQLCAGVAAAHQRGVIHRDLKPANVMLDGAGRVRVMDFGLAAAGQVEDVRAGTPAYMAPEQLLGREVTTRSDIFALGLVMYELFTGRRGFTAGTIGELVNQHESGALTAPSALVTGMDPRVERAILRCLEAEPDRRPASALAVSAALPGGDPLGALLAAGETPSPEMVAAAGEGAGLRPRVAWPVYLAVLAGMGVALTLALPFSALNQMRPEYGPEVLRQKAHEAIARIGYTERPGDEAYGFGWDDDFMKYVKDHDKPTPRWSDVFANRPSPLVFWYRQSPDPLTGAAFHDDLLTPGVVYDDDPPPIRSGMTRVTLDHYGHLTFFERIPPERQDAATPAAAVDWNALFALAGLDPSTLRPAEPLWTWLATSDTRSAWTGEWPGSKRPLRVEGAALGGHPVAFMVTGPWRTPARMPAESPGRQRALGVVLVTLAVAILAGAGLLARTNLRDGRGDRRGAGRLAASMAAVLLALWICQTHLVASVGLLGTFLIALCTSIFYAVVIWTIYVALEPFVRRHWPQVLVSSTNVLTGRVRDPVVGRDVLFGTLLGVAWMVMLIVLDVMTGVEGISTFPGAPEVLLGLRGTVGEALQEAPYAVRNVLMYFFVLFVLRVVLRNQWLAALGFAAGFATLNALGSERHGIGALVGFLYFGSAAFAVLRWGLVSFTVGAFVVALLSDVPATLDTSAWYFGNSWLLIGVAVALATWGFYTSLGGRLWKTVPLR